MVKTTGFSRSELSIAVTAAFFTYGAGQLLSGWLGDRMQPRTVVLIGLLVTSVINFSIPFCRSIALITVLWGVNGLAQAFMWPPLVRLMAYLFEGDEYIRISVRTSWGASCGTILLYLVSPLIISLLGWRYVFAASGVSGLLMSLFWALTCCRIDPAREAKRSGTDKASPTQKPRLERPFIVTLLLLVLAIIFQGVLRDGVATWMPSLISETYDLSSQISILTGVMLPIFTFICVNLTSLMNRKLIKSPVAMSCALFGTSAAAAVVLNLFNGSSPAVSVLSTSLLNGCAHGVNLMLLVMIPPVFKKRGNVSLVSGILNACAYIGASISTYGIAYISENYSWSVTLLIWLALAAGGALLCLVCIRPWAKYSKKLLEE